LVHPREVFQPAVDCGAAAFILVHNHPSGVLTPSPDDIQVTKQLVEAGKIMGIRLVDHVIAGPSVEAVLVFDDMHNHAVPFDPIEAFPSISVLNPSRDDIPGISIHDPFVYSGVP
jgi:hypothetical protein